MDEPTEEPDDIDERIAELEHEIRLQLGAGETEESIYRNLVAADYPEEVVAAVLAEVLRDRKRPIGGGPRFESGGWDIGGMVNDLNSRDAEFRKRRNERRQKRLKDVPHEETEPNPDLDLGDDIATRHQRSTASEDRTRARIRIVMWAIAILFVGLVVALYFGFLH